MRYLYLLFILGFYASLSATTNSEFITEEEECTPYLFCESHVNVALPSYSCETMLEAAWLVNSALSSCGITPTLSLTNNGPFGPGDYAIGVYARVGADFAYCTVHITVEDKTDPVLECTNQIIYTSNPNSVVINVGELLEVSDNCGTDISFSTYDSDEGYGTFPFSGYATDYAGNSGDCTGSYSIRPYTDSYCASAGRTNYEYIERVRLSGRTSFDNSSGDNDGYGYYINHSANLAIGESASITLVPGYPGGTYTEYWTVYIDINDDNYFSGSEKVYQWAGRGTHVGSFSVPGTIAHLGSHRMRVSMRYGGYPGPCSGSFDGEVEDYMVYIGYYISWPWWGFREATEDQLTINTNQDDLSTTAVTTTDQAVDSRPIFEERPTTVPKQEAVIYPNPLRLGQVPSVQLPSNHGVSQLQLSNSLGQLLVNQSVIESGAHNLQLNASDKIRNNGAYLLRALGNQGQLLWTKRMLVQ